MAPKSVYFIGSILGIFHAIIVYLTYKKVPEPYMDEIFHIDQVRAYCRGDYGYWNKSITTLPALYLLTPRFLCHGAERYMNSLFFCLLFIGLYKLRKKFNSSGSHTEAILTCLSISFLPVLFDTSILFYTDLLALTTVVWGFASFNPQISALFFFTSVLTRQTNIVWAGLYVFCALVKNFDGKMPLKSLFLTSLKHHAFILLLLSFLLFLYFNQGIVVGDKTAHEAMIHIPQLFYFFGFLLFSTIPLFISDLMKVFERFYKKWYYLIPISFLMYLGIDCCTFAHRYLLADNRHYTFYLWRRWYMKFPEAKYYSIIVYITSLTFAFPKIVDRQGYILSIFGLICTSMTLIFAPLLEFRYFIIPYTLWRISITERQHGTIFMEIMFHLMVNFVAIFMFFKKPFRWQHDPTNLQRFMW